MYAITCPTPVYASSSEDPSELFDGEPELITVDLWVGRSRWFVVPLWTILMKTHQYFFELSAQPSSGCNLKWRHWNEVQVLPDSQCDIRSRWTAMFRVVSCVWLYFYFLGAPRGPTIKYDWEADLWNCRRVTGRIKVISGFLLTIQNLKNEKWGLLRVKDLMIFGWRYL